MYKKKVKEMKKKSLEKDNVEKSNSWLKSLTGAKGDGGANMSFLQTSQGKDSTGMEHSTSGMERYIIDGVLPAERASTPKEQKARASVNEGKIVHDDNNNDELNTHEGDKFTQVSRRVRRKKAKKTNKSENGEVVLKPDAGKKGLRQTNITSFSCKGKNKRMVGDTSIEKSSKGSVAQRPRK